MEFLILFGRLFESVDQVDEYALGLLAHLLRRWLGWVWRV